ncbi:unnamed protein product [Clavelina lepadiformis]|uniref:glutathione transferase n=1 Tax=Clavelina lepadiformis TaxID=159417 RepID=A0ABP0F681_CLALP
MPNYKLVYFNSKGRAEVVRLMFAEAGIEFEDKRVQEEDWPQLKPTMPFGQLPVLYIDDKPPLPQSGAIERYVARELNFDGGSSLAFAYIDMVCNVLEDVGSKVPFMEEDEAKKAAGTKDALENHIYPAFDKIEKKFKEGGEEFLIAKRLTLADLAIFHFSDVARVIDANFITKYPTLDALCKRVAARPSIKKYLENRPKTPL